MTPTALEPLVVAGVKDALYADGICGLSGAFAPEFVGRLHDQCLLLHDEASSYEGGRVNRGRNRWYFGVHPQQLSGIVELLSHPWLVAICREVLGPDYQIAEVAFDISWPGSAYQPWHRDFRREIGMDPEGRLTALAFNLPTVGVTDEMGPLEVIHGTHTDTIASDVDGMFPDQAGQARYEQDSRRTPKKPQRGDMSVRTPLAIHRGTPNLSPMVRPVMVATVYTGGSPMLEGHVVPTVTRDFYDGLPAIVRDHLRCRVVDKLQPIVQEHDIEGLKMG